MMRLWVGTSTLLIALTTSVVAHAECVTDCANAYMTCDKNAKGDQVGQASCQDVYTRCKDRCAMSKPSPSPSPHPKSPQ